MTFKIARLRLALLTILLSAGVGAQAAPAQPTAEMKAVLDQLAALGGKPLQTLMPDQARKQPTPADAVKALLVKEKQSTDPEAVAKIESIEIPGPAGVIKARIYWPLEGTKPHPVVHYIHGGGWVIADLDTYDSSPRAIANAANAIVVSTHYRQAPQHPFPAAHEDSLAAYRWIVQNAASFDGDPKRVAVAGESAGGNMAADIALRASSAGVAPPIYQVLIYPVTDTTMNTESYRTYAKAKPLNADLMQWFFKHTLARPANAQDPRIALLRAPLNAKLPPATIITAEIDPLQSEGQQYAERLKTAGVTVHFHDYKGVTHEFFGMGAVVPQAKEAVTLVGSHLKTAFGVKQKAAITQASPPLARVRD